MGRYHYDGPKTSIHRRLICGFDTILIIVLLGFFFFKSDSKIETEMQRI